MRDGMEFRNECLTEAIVLLAQAMSMPMGVSGLEYMRDAMLRIADAFREQGYSEGHAAGMDD